MGDNQDPEEGYMMVRSQFLGRQHCRFTPGDMFCRLKAFGKYVLRGGSWN